MVTHGFEVSIDHRRVVTMEARECSRDTKKLEQRKSPVSACETQVTSKRDRSRVQHAVAGC